MKLYELKDVSVKTSTRENGTQAALRIFEILMSDEMFEIREETNPDGSKNMLMIPDPDGAVIDIPENSDASTSFFDEIVYRLSEQNQLHRIRFQIHDESIHVKLQNVSNNRMVPVGIVLNGENRMIEPSSKPTKKKEKIIYQDL